MDILREIEILQYLLEQISTVEEYTEGMDENAFFTSKAMKDASLTRLMVLGEYSARLDDTLKARFSEVQWQLIKAARNFYAHVYRGIDWVMVWEVVHTELPPLKEKIENIIATLLEEQNNAETN